MYLDSWIFSYHSIISWLQKNYKCFLQPCQKFKERQVNGAFSCANRQSPDAKMHRDFGKNKKSYSLSSQSDLSDQREYPSGSGSPQQKPQPAPQKMPAAHLTGEILFRFAQGGVRGDVVGFGTQVKDGAFKIQTVRTIDLDDLVIDTFQHSASSLKKALIFQ